MTILNRFDILLLVDSNVRRDEVPNLKDRQHRTRGGIGFSFITHKPRGAEYHVIYQMKAMIFVYALVLSNKIKHVD